MITRRRAFGLAMSSVVVVAILSQGAVMPADKRSSPSERIHEVKRGDTLTAIARTYGVSVAAIISVNGLPEQGGIKVGQRLRIPPATFEPAAEPTGPAADGVTVRRPPPRAPASFYLAIPDFGDFIPIFTWPVEGPVSSPFGRRRSGWHRGIDIKADLGVPVIAAAGGVVTASGYEARYGRVVKIEHPNGFVTVYAHNDHNFVDIGERVTTGYLIASIGRTGRATAHHLHFEIRRAGLVYNPLYLLPLPPRVARIEEESDDEESEESDE